MYVASSLKLDSFVRHEELKDYGFIFPLLCLYGMNETLKLFQ